MTLAAVTGLEAEARLLRRHKIVAAATGGDPERTAESVAKLLATATALVSFGLAGALAQGLAPGTLLLPRRVLSEGAEVAVDAAWRARLEAGLRAQGLSPVADDLFGAASVVASPADKARLYQRTGAVAVDLESADAAAVAQRFERPFVALRAIADPADFALPPAACVGLDPSGHIAFVPVLASILREPGQVPALVRLARHTRRAMAVLARAAAVLSPPGGEG